MDLILGGLSDAQIKGVLHVRQSNDFCDGTASTQSNPPRSGSKVGDENVQIQNICGIRLTIDIIQHKNSKVVENFGLSRCRTNASNTCCTESQISRKEEKYYQLLTAALTD